MTSRDLPRSRLSSPALAESRAISPSSQVAEGLNPADANVLNNLAAAYEADGQLGGARCDLPRSPPMDSSEALGRGAPVETPPLTSTRLYGPPY